MTQKIGATLGLEVTGLLLQKEALYWQHVVKMCQDAELGKEERERERKLS